MPGVDYALLEKIFTTTPGAITSLIAKFCRELSPGHRARYVQVVPEPDALPGECFPNVLAKVKAAGGEIRYGWAIWTWPRVFVEAEHHGVWDDGSGALFDVTPHVHGETRILFLPDPERRYDFEGRQRLINVKRSLGEVPIAEKWVAAADRLSRFTEAHRVGNRFQMDQGDFEPLARATQIAKAELLIELARRTRSHEPCICGSGQKFRKCCRPMIHLDAD